MKLYVRPSLMTRAKMEWDPQDYRIVKKDPPQAACAITVLEAMGFELCSTGGGCTAYIFTRPDGQRCMVTDDAEAPTPKDNHWTVGFYNADDGQHYKIADYERGTLQNTAQALADIARWMLG
jgi:hypothetical protein